MSPTLPCRNQSPGRETTLFTAKPKTSARYVKMPDGKDRKVMQGCFAINKPLGISSAQVLRNLQTHFDPSDTFASYMYAEETVREQESPRQQKKRRGKKGPPSVKIGHGGTLDPEASGVLIVGIGAGTKSLQDFLSCTKTYECVVLFGAATDTYDAVGKVVSKKPYDHITRDMVWKAMDSFKGKIKQMPPIYSALSVQGKRLYEYAREGKEVPIEIKARDAEVFKITMKEWYAPGKHKFKWPVKEAEKEEKAVVEKLLHAAGDKTTATMKRKRVADEDDSTVKETPESKRTLTDDDAPTMSGALPTSSNPNESKSAASGPVESASDNPFEGPETKGKATKDEATKAEVLKSDVCKAEASESEVNKDEASEAGATRSDVLNPEMSKLGASTAGASIAGSSKPVAYTAGDLGPPAARIRMTVGSGFYVRSFCHDLGEAVGSAAHMSTLVRTRQEKFELGQNVFEYRDLTKGEAVWGPKIETVLQQWEDRLKEVLPAPKELKTPWLNDGQYQDAAQ